MKRDYHKTTAKYKLQDLTPSMPVKPIVLASDNPRDRIVDLRQPVSGIVGVRKGCYDNIVVVSFFSSLKNELIHHRDYHTRD